MLTPAQKTLTVWKKLTEEQLVEESMIQERMQQVLFLLQNLVAQEEVTFKTILDCLYDIGSANLINQKFRSRPLNKLMKSIAAFSKPLFRSLAFYWVKKNCPKLIADWLRSQVSFGNPG